MKRILFGLLISITLFAQGRLLSPIPLPRLTIVDLDPDFYDKEHLKNALDEGMIFTFLAKSKGIDDPEITALRDDYLAMFRMKRSFQEGEEYRVTFMVPRKRIGKYAVSTTHTVLAYLLQRKIPFSMVVEEIEDEEIETIKSVLDTVSDSDLIVAPLTRRGVEALCSLALPVPVYVPTFHKKRVDCAAENVRFGGIDYDRQIETLSYMVESNASTYVVSDDSPLSLSLEVFVEKYLPVKGVLRLGKNGYYKDTIAQYDDLNQSTLFLNTPVVKSSLFLSQMTLADFKPEKVLSTQLNYSPRLLTLTQFHDRENMTIANSIGEAEPALTESIALIGQDIRFNWINYATLVGVDVDYFQKLGSERWTKENFVAGSVEYEITLYDAGLYRFVPRPLPSPPEEIDPEIEMDESYQPFLSDFQEERSD